MSRFLPILAAALLCFATACRGTTGQTAEDCTYAVPECEPPAGLAYYALAPPNVMLLVDRSSSMRQSGTCPGGACPSKWEQLMTLQPYVGEIDATGTLGLTLFPAQDATDLCDVGDTVTVPIGEDTSNDVLDVLRNTEPWGNTPLAAALDLLHTRACLAHPARDNVVIVLTDGLPNCACSGRVDCERTTAFRAASRLANEGPEPVELYVIGFGTSAEGAADTLQAVARAAEATSGTDNFYRADTVEELAERMYRVAGQLGGCSYVLDDAVDPDKLQVFVDDASVDRCTEIPCESGWSTEDGKSVRLLGVACRLAASHDCPSVRFELEG